MDEISVIARETMEQPTPTPSRTRTINTVATPLVVSSPMEAPRERVERSNVNTTPLAASTPSTKLEEEEQQEKDTFAVQRRSRYLDEGESLMEERMSVVKGSKSKIKIPIFTGDGDFEEWLEEFEFTANLCQWNESTKIIKFYENLSGTAKKVFKNMDEIVLKKYNRIIKVFLENFGDVKSRYDNFKKLSMRRQRENENVINYAMEIKILCKKVNTDMDEEDKLMYFVNGLKNEIKYEVRRTDPERLEEAIKIAVRTEQNLKDINQFRHYSNYNKFKNINENKNYNKFNSKEKSVSVIDRSGKPPGKIDSQKNEKMNKNNNNNYLDRKNKEEVVCYNCGKKGHLQRNCRAPKNQRIKGKEVNIIEEDEETEEETSEEESEETTVNAISTKGLTVMEKDLLQNEEAVIDKEINVATLQEFTNYSSMVINGKIEDLEVECIIDTGSAVSIINKTLMENLNGKFKLEKSKVKNITLPNNDIIKVIGEVKLKTQLTLEEKEINYLVIEPFKYLCLL